MALGELKDKRAVDSLFQALNDKSERVQRNALNALVIMGDTRAVEPLLHILRDKQREDRVSAISTLGKLGDKRGVDPILKFLFESPRNIFHLEYHKRIGRSSFREARILANIESALRNISARSCYDPSFPRALIADIIEASGYYQDYEYPLPQGGRAVQATKRICNIKSPITSNLLHLVIQKKAIFYSTPIKDGFASAEKKKLDFHLQRNIAKEELENRGNPPYQPNAYFKN
jgi:hypothetical protein